MELQEDKSMDYSCPDDDDLPRLLVVVAGPHCRPIVLFLCLDKDLPRLLQLFLRYIMMDSIIFHLFSSALHWIVIGFCRPEAHLIVIYVCNIATTTVSIMHCSSWCTDNCTFQKNGFIFNVMHKEMQLLWMWSWSGDGERARERWFSFILLLVTVILVQILLSCSMADYADKVHFHGFLLRFT